MSQVTGNVEAISSKKVGKGYLYGLKVDGQWYNCGFKKPPAEKGEDVTFTLTKNDKGYDEAIFGEKTANPKGTTAPAAKPAQATYTRDFETSEERAKKQVYIIRQSSLERALDLCLAKAAKGGVDVEEVLQTSERFVDYVLHGYGVKAVLEMDDDIPM
jgi:hypothetical protein